MSVSGNTLRRGSDANRPRRSGAVAHLFDSIEGEPSRTGHYPPGCTRNDPTSLSFPRSRSSPRESGERPGAVAPPHPSTGQIQTVAILIRARGALADKTRRPRPDCADRGRLARRTRSRLGRRNPAAGFSVQRGQPSRAPFQVWQARNSPATGTGPFAPGGLIILASRYARGVSQLWAVPAIPPPPQHRRASTPHNPPSSMGRCDRAALASHGCPWRTRRPQWRTDVGAGARWR